MKAYTSEEMNSLYADVFGHGNGRIVLAHILLNAIVAAPPFDPKLIHAEAHAAGVREHALEIARRAGVPREQIAYALAGIVPVVEPKEETDGPE